MSLRRKFRIPYSFENFFFQKNAILWMTACFVLNIQGKRGKPHFWTFPSMLVPFYCLQTFESNGKLNQVSITIYAFWGSLQDPHKVLTGSLRIFTPTFATWRSSKIFERSFEDLWKILIFKDLLQVFADLQRSLKILKDLARFFTGAGILIRWAGQPSLSERNNWY